MDSFEFNKIAGGLLAATLVIWGSRIFVNEVMVSKSPETPGIEIAAVEPEDKSETKGADASGGSAKPEVSMVALVKAADVAAGEKVTKACKACHSFNEGGKNGIGPALYGIVGKKIAADESFKYSKALQEKDGAWDTASLNGFLKKPNQWAKGTKMGYAGLRKETDRANIIAYLRSISPDAPPLPE